MELTAKYYDVMAGLPCSDLNAPQEPIYTFLKVFNGD